MDACTFKIKTPCLTDGPLFFPNSPAAGKYREYDRDLKQHVPFYLRRAFGRRW